MSKRSRSTRRSATAARGIGTAAGLEEESEGSLPGDVVLRVVARTDAFARVWPELSESAGVRLDVVDRAADLTTAGEPCGTIVALAGDEANAAEAVDEARAHGAGEVVVVGAAEHHRPAVAAVQAGASNYFALPPDLEALRSWVVERAQRAQGRERAAALATRERTRYDFSRLIGSSEGLRRALERAARVIPRGGATILITGETGTGKELLAQAIHYNGPRAPHPFVEINCTALPPTLLEAELFGYEKGAFTDARAPKPGLFEAADGGTLFLDEIGDLPVDIQAKLLKVLEDRNVRRLGSLRSRTIDVRIVAATHVDLAAAVRHGRFREDLYFRLAVLPIHLPPLRDRDGDILLLTEYFLDRFSQEYDAPRPDLTAAIRATLLSHTWPGNVRELRNAIERAVLLGDGELHTDDLFLEGVPTAESLSADAALPFPASLDRIEAAAARAMLEHLGGNKRAAADALGISRSRLYRLLDRPV